MSPRRHGPVQRKPSCSRTWGTSVSPLHARRWSRCPRTFSRNSRNDIDRSAWVRILQVTAACAIYCSKLTWRSQSRDGIAEEDNFIFSHPQQFKRRQRLVMPRYAQIEIIDFAVAIEILRRL